MCCTQNLLLSKCVLVQIDDYICLTFEMGKKKKSLWSWLCTETIYAHLDAQPFEYSRVQAGGDGFFIWKRQAATFHTAPHPHPPCIHRHTRTRTHGEVEQESSVTTSHLSQSPSSRSAAPTSQLSSPNTLHSISAPREWFIDRTASRQRNVLFLFRQLDWKCMLFDSQAWKWAQGGSRLGSVKSPRDGTNEF